MPDQTYQPLSPMEPASTSDEPCTPAFEMSIASVIDPTPLPAVGDPAFLGERKEVSYPGRVSESDTVGNLMPPEPFMLRALDLFFRHIYYMPVFSIVHQASIMEKYRTGVLDNALTLAIAGIAASLLDLGPGTRDLGARYIDGAESIIIADMEKPSVPRIQALILIIKHRTAARRFSSVYLLTAIAVRFAMALRLNYEDPRMSFLAREGCRRVMWSLFMIDKVLAGGYQDFMLCPVETMHIRLPCRERNYKLNLPEKVDKLQMDPMDTDGSELGSLALTIRIMWLRHRVLQFSKRAVVTHNANLEPEIRTFQEEFEAYIEHLPPSFRLSETNIRLHAYSTTLPAFVIIHVTWYETRCVLYRLAIEGLKEALPSRLLHQLDPSFVQYCKISCLECVKALTVIFRNVLSLKLDTFIVDVDMAVYTYQTVRLLSHLCRLMPEAMSAEEFSTRTAYCLDFLKSVDMPCEAIDAIRRDTEVLIEQGLSPPSTPAEPVTRQASITPPAPEASETTPHVLSRHNYVRQMEIPNRTESQLLPEKQSDVPDPRVRTPLPSEPYTMLSNHDISAAEHDLVALNGLHNMHSNTVLQEPYHELGLLQFEMNSSILLQDSLFELGDLGLG